VLLTQPGSRGGCRLTVWWPRPS